MSFASRYKTDKVAEAEGLWVDFGDDVAVKIARLSNKDAKELRRKLEKPYRNFNQLPDDVAEKILIDVVAQTVVKGWKGIEHEGKPLELTPENAAKVFKEYPDFFNDVVTASASKETYAAAEETAAKNS